MLDMKDVQVWLKGLIHAGISGSTAAISTALVAPETFNFSNGLSKLLTVAGVSAIVSIAKYLSAKPLPEDLPDEKPN